MAFNFDDDRLDPGLRAKIAVELDYKTLINLCNTLSKNVFKSICKNNWFWEQKTKYDFRDLYDIEELEENWWDTYQLYRKRFTEDLLIATRSIKVDKIRRAKRLLKINKEKEFLIVDETDEDGRTALILASVMHHTDIVKMLLEAGANPNLTDGYGKTALMWAAYWGRSRTSIVKMLLEAGAKPNLTDKDGKTALMLASEKGHTDIVKMLLNAEANPNLVDVDGKTALMEASRNGHTDIVEMLLAAEVDPNLTDKDGRTALMWASRNGHRDIVEMLLAAEADPDLTDKDGRTALMWASEKGHTAIVEILLKAETNPNIMNKWGYTALMEAYNNGSPEDIIYKLIKAGTDPNIQYNIGNKDHGGWTFLMWIIYDYSYTDIAKELILTDPRTDLNIVNEDGKTALIMAYGHNTEMFKLLLKTNTVNGEFLWDLTRDGFYDCRW